MSDAPASTGAKGVAYAEDQLGVHLIHESAKIARKEFDAVSRGIADKKTRKRELESRIQDREMELAEEERIKHVDMSQAAMERKLKVVFHNDRELRILRNVLLETNAEIDLAEYELRGIEADIKIAVARLQELGGYLNYLAAIKQAELAKRQEKQEKQE